MGDVRPVIAVTGLKREGALVEGDGVLVVAGGGDAAHLRHEIEAATSHAAGIISFGMAGALDPSLKLGDWVIGDAVTGAVAAPCDPAWAEALAASLPQARRGTVHADGRLIADPAERAALFASGAIAADMESHVAAEVAARTGLPFAVLRCVSDEAGATLPPAIAVAMKPGGGLAIGQVLGSLIRQPSQIPALCRTGRDFSRAYAALKDGARTVGPRLAVDRR